MMGSFIAELYSEIDKLRAQLLHNVELMSDRQWMIEEISDREILTRIENVILGIVTSLSKDEAPVLALPNRSSWANISFDSAVGLQMSSGSSVTTIRSDCSSSITKFAQILKILAAIYRLVQSNSYSTKRDIYYNNPQLFVSQRTVDSIVDDISCMLKVPRRSLHVGKGMPDVNSRLMVRKLWDTLHIPIFALVDADPHGMEIMCVYKYGSVAMSFEAHSLTVPSVMWLGLLPSDLQRLRVPEDALIPLTKRDQSKLNSLLERPYLSSQSDWQKEMELMQQSKVKAEIQSLDAIAPDFLTSIYLPNKLRYGGWV
ncbi:meiotic recombination protein SPO11 isoform X9 [Notolabrus celidotus]|uniref:meiotic recombination protein SPO11 isoform X9 n=1 Tax=Notolabrus celidotus TaxID=1203425 RepID=UPI00148FB2EB|nr:meiotic recombination protein SPO11 isoform X9 [Notolabrus celidotus]